LGLAKANNSIGDQSFDAKAGSIINMFNSTNNHHAATKLFLDNSTGLEKASLQMA
jgi:hypothetical protein